jgi:hypothetical protein
MPRHQPQPGLEFVSELSDRTIGTMMLIFTLGPFSLPVLVLTALTAVTLVILASSAWWWLRRSCWCGGGGDCVIACPAILSPSRAATAQRERGRAAAPERPAARLPPSRWDAIASTPKRLEAQQG